MNSASLKILACAPVLAALTGCVDPTPRLDSEFGYAVNAAKAQQTINPDAAKNPDPVAGIDGTSARHTIDLYHKSFEAPPPTTNVININVGGSGR